MGNNKYKRLNGKGVNKMELQVIPVYLPDSVQQELYNTMLQLARKAVDTAKQEIKVNVNTRYLNKKGLCDYFTCAPKVIEDWQREGLKSFQKGKEIMFDIYDVHKFLDTKKF